MRIWQDPDLQHCWNVQLWLTSPATDPSRIPRFSSPTKNNFFLSFIYYGTFLSYIHLLQSSEIKVRKKSQNSKKQGCSYFFFLDNGRIRIRTNSYGYRTDGYPTLSENICIILGDEGTPWTFGWRGQETVDPGQAGPPQHTAQVPEDCRRKAAFSSGTLHVQEIFDPAYWEYEDA